MNPQYSRFMIKSDIPYRIRDISAINIKTSFIGIFKSHESYYAYVQISNRKRIYQNTLIKKLNITHDKVFNFKYINPGLELIEKKGEIVNPGPINGVIKNKKRKKEIICGINEIEDISHIKYEEIISIIKSEIIKKTEEIKNETLKCSCFETPCQNCRLPKCEKCYFVIMKENHSNRKCEEIKDIFYKIM